MRSILSPARALAAVLLIAATGSMGCASSAAVRAAERGSFDEARRAIAADVAAGRVSPSEARAIARAVAEGEVDRAAGPVGVDRIRELSACGRALGDAFERKASRFDDVGAAAATARLDARLADTSERARYAAIAMDGGDRGLAPGSAGPWRAAGARALTTPADGALRRRLVGDGDQDVRLGALRAALEAADQGDAASVLDAARLDPYPLARTIALRAAGALGGERVVLALKDAWATADAASREAIADAWATPASVDAGGRRELVWAIESQRGAPAVAAAYALSRLGGAGSTDAVAVLARAIASGPSRDRIFAIQVAPLSAPAVRDAVIEAERDTDESVALAAVARRFETPADTGGTRPGSSERAAELARLVKVAGAGGAQSFHTEGVLTRAGAREVVPLLVSAAASKDARARAVAATNLALIGELPRAAVLALDPEPSVRTAASCAILSAR